MIPSDREIFLTAFFDGNPYPLSSPFRWSVPATSPFRCGISPTLRFVQPISAALVQGRQTAESNSHFFYLWQKMNKWSIKVQEIVPEQKKQ